MKPRLGAWAFLRPLLLALAAAASWITLSAAGASADTSASSDSLLGAGPSTVIAVPATVAHPATDVLEPVEAGLGGNLGSAPASSTPTPPLRPAVEEATGLVDQVVETVPVLDRMVPDGMVAAVANPAVGTVDGLVGGAVGTLVPLAGAALDLLDPVLEPAISAVPLSVAAPEGAPDGTPPAVTEVPQVIGETAAQIMPASTRAVSPAAVPGNAPVDAPQEPAIPAVTTGGSSPSGSHVSAMPAWLGASHFQIPPAGWAVAQARLLAVPAPVSFDPGSSPD